VTGKIGRRRLLTGAAAGAVLAGCSDGSSSPTRVPLTRSPRALRPTRDTGGRPPAGGSLPVPGQAPAAASVIRARSHVPVLCFHQIRPWRATDSPAARSIITPPDRFAEQMAGLARAGHTAITPDQLVAYLRFGVPLPARPVLLTFDDASEGQYTHALPILRRHRFAATFFVMTVVLDKPRWLSRSQVRDLHRQGMTIGAHTWDHHPVTGYSGGDWRTQLVEPARELARLTGEPVRFFAYP
jgi:hypothetical protein